MTNLASRVASRFSSRRQPMSQRIAARWLKEAGAYKPPKYVVNGVDSGELPSKVLMIWKYVAEKLMAKSPGKLNYGAATAYWRSKCAKEGIHLPAQYQKGGPPATAGPWKVKNGDQIEEWVRERLQSEGMISNAVKTAAEWELEISHLESAMEDAKARIAKHKQGLAEGSRVNQRIKWLASAESDLKSASKDLAKANEAVKALTKAVERHPTNDAPIIDFEKQFQAALSIATKDLSKTDILDAARAALAKFEGQVEASEAEAAELPDDALDVQLSDDPEMEWSRYAKQAGVTDWILEGMKKVWDSVKGAFGALTSWATDLLSDTKTLNKMLDAAGAKK